MQDGTIFQHRILSQELSPNLSEAYRYAGITKNFPQDEFSIDPEIEKLATDAVKEISDNMNPRSVYIRFPLTITETDKKNDEGKPLFQIQFANVKFLSHYLGLNLKDCHAIYLFAATLGPAVDRSIQKAARLNAAKSVMLQAAGAMFIEEYCDLLQNKLLKEEEKEGNTFRPRFSPGYGDIPLTMQNTFFELLQCQKNLALTLNNSLIMSPEKSVTAFIGVKKSDN